MRLSKYEEEMLNGQHGQATQMAMEIIVRLGELYGAEELIPITQAHIDGGLYTAVGEAGLEFAEKLNSLGAKVVVPTTMNATSRDINCWQEHKVDREFADKNTRMEQAYVGMGVIPTWTCTPYQTGIQARFGEQIAWAESNAIVYVNSVIGARTERYGDYTDICCAITGRVPKFGLHLKENRRGQAVLHCGRLELNSTDDFAALGYLVGKVTKDKIPVLTGVPEWVGSDQLKAFSAAVASSGSVALFHMTGITPEAPDEETALQGKTPEMTIELTQHMLDESRRELTKVSQQNNQVDAVLLGCPHASAPELIELSRRLKGKHIAEDIELWVYTNQTAYDWLKNTTVVEELKNAGVKIIRDTCFVNTDLSQWDFKTVMTNSAKYAHYIPSRTGKDVIFADMDQCLMTAINGKDK